MHRSHDQHPGGRPTGGLNLGGGSALRVCIHGGWADPPELEKHVVRILLECFLVKYNFITGMFSQVCVKNSVHGEGGLGGCTPSRQTPPQADPLGRHPLR